MLTAIWHTLAVLGAILLVVVIDGAIRLLVHTMGWNRYIDLGWIRCRILHKQVPAKDFFMLPYGLGSHMKYYWKCACGNTWDMTEDEEKRHRGALS